jgi:lipoprotein-anchoring transpeptidase ErfK/SrfK
MLYCRQMIGFRLSSYVSKARANGVSDEQIKTELLNAGWRTEKIEKALSKGSSATLATASGEVIAVPQRTNKKVVYAMIFIGALVLVALGVMFWGVKTSQADKTLGIVKDHLVPPVKVDTDTILEEDKINPDTKDIYIKDKVDFVEADLDAKVVHLYQAGVETKSYEILAFGKDGSWWETPTGDYTALNKETRHFSSIGEVWMPWSINFYGNFFIHGWPYYEGGEPVEPGHSGGCIRLSVDDAKDLYQYVNKGTPIIVRETTLLSKFGSLSMQKTPAPEVSASAFLVQNISTGEKYAKKNINKVVANAPIAKLMTAVIASNLFILKDIFP